MSWIKRHPNLTLTLVGIIIALVLAEILLRLFAPVESVISDPILGHRGNPIVDFYDKNGFRNEKVLDKAEIVAIGDSQTEGNNTSDPSEAWPQVLGKLSGKSVYQMAVGGYNPIQYSILFDKALKLSPETIFVGFYTGNDLMEVFNAVYSGDKWKELRNPDFSYKKSGGQANTRFLLQYGQDEDSIAASILRFRLWVRSKSALYTFLGRSTRVLREKLGLAETKDERNNRIENWIKDKPDLGFVYDKEPIKTLLGPNYRLDTVDLSDPRTAEGWRIAKNLFAKMAAKSREKNIEFIIVIIPTKEMVYGTYINESGKEMESDLDVFVKAESNLRDEIFSLCNELRVQCIDSLPGLVDELKKGNAIYPREMDGHPIPNGYSAIAKQVFQIWTSRK